MNDKNLHKHSLPVVGVLLAVFVVSLSLASYAPPAGTTNLLSRAFVARLVVVAPNANGQARIQVNTRLAGSQTEYGAGQAATSQFQAIGKSSGKLVRLNFVVEALHPSLLPTKSN